MTSKNQLQSKIQELEAELQSFKQQLGSYKETPTIQEASVGDVLEDGSIVLKKENGLALLVAPKVTEVEATWSKDFPEVFQQLKEQGFNPSQWFIPTQEQLVIAYNNLCDEFSSTFYWSSTDDISFYACNVNFGNGNAYSFNKADANYVRAFRCVTY
jgi:hypothetical protein